MLAGKGFAYRSEQTATLGGSFHNGCCTLSKPWPDEVIQPYRQVWEHILGNHGSRGDLRPQQDRVPLLVEREARQA